MVELITPPDPQSLLPPLLAFLPTAFASARPPPDLLPLLSPILRQRLQIFTSTSTSNHDSWLRLLCWDSAKAEALKERIENANFEPHPSSGEIEVGEVDTIKYKRFDHETLRAQLPLPDWTFTALYLWCTGSDEGQGWRLAELLPYDSDLASDQTWSMSVKEANEKSEEKMMMSEASHEAGTVNRSLSIPGQEDEDDDYWAQYDKTPARTPARKSSVVPAGGNATESDYYERYGDVQPAMDSHDPDEEIEDAGESTLNGGVLQQILSQQTEQPQETTAPPYQDRLGRAEDDDVVHVNHPVPSSPSSRGGSDTVARLEETAERYASSEVGIRQHIGFSVKSMYRLAKSAGISREEFERMVQRELDTLSMLDRDD